MVVWATVLAAGVAAQEELPQITPGERKVARKKDAGPRALALLRLTAKGKASLVPICILIDGKFWDATAYKASPIPMALEPGIVYEAERTGNSLGLFTVGTALHSNAANAPSPWLATGTWLPAGTEVANKALKAESTPVGIDTSDQPPRLTRNPSKETPPPASTAPASPPPSGPSSGDEPPRLTKPAPAAAPPASTPQSSSAPQSSSTGSAGSSPSGSSPPPSSQPAPSATGSAAPAESKPADAKPEDHANVPASDSGATDANRPRLRRGKPTEPLPEEEVPGYSKPGAAPSSAKAAKTVETPVAPEPVQLVPAISDAGGPEPRSYTFEWLKDEEGERRQQITDLAKEQLRAYLNAQAKAQAGPKPAASQAQRHAPGRKSPEPVLENVHMVAFDVWTTNQPVMIFSAEAHLPPPPAGAQGGVETGLQYSITLVAYPDIYNNLHKLYVGITDKYHLDLTPRLELIDAVDADGDGRGELLFRETTDAGSGWVIYRPTADTLWKMYDSLNPE
ncbi:MAG: hypothetical protein ACLQBK_02420 [Candidatus Sulfotelmatobacter sp.]